MASCAECHPKVATSYSHSGMARSFGAVRPHSGFAELKAGAFRHEPSDESFSVFTRDGAAILRREQAANVVEHRIDYWFGSGNHARSYISRNATGELIELPLTWYAENGGHWGMSPAYDFPQHAGFSRKITYRCLFCHNGYPDLAPGADRWENDTRLPNQLPSGINCERCHGPGRAHTKAARLGSPPAVVRAAIVNPARLPAVRQTEICLQCHLETTNTGLPGFLLRYGRGVFSYRPGEPLGDYMLFFDHAPGAGYDDKFEFASAPYRLRKSRCYLQTGDALTCTTCHNPHPADGVDARSRYARACQNCHASTLERLVREQRHTASVDCVSCHMPKRHPSDAVHVTITDHYIQRSPKPDPTGPLVEHNGSNTPPYRGKVVLYYPETITEPADGALYLAVAQLKNQANVEEGIAHLEKAIAKWKPVRAEFYSDLADAYRHTGRPDKAAALYREACSRDPEAWPAFFGLGMALAASGDVGHVAQSLQRALSLAPWQAEIVKSLAGVLTDASKSQEALTTLRAAVSADPDSGDLRNSLGAALTRAGDFAVAGIELREAVRLRPEVPAIRVNLATWLARVGAFPEARDEFERAIRMDHSFAEAYSAYGTALAAHGDLTEARDRFKVALNLNPRMWNTHNNLGTLLQQLGDPEGAIGEYRAAIAIRSDFSLAHYNLGVALAARGSVAEARRHLQRAAQSSDPKLRQAAINALKRANL